MLRSRADQQARSGCFAGILVETERHVADTYFVVIRALRRIALRQNRRGDRDRPSLACIDPVEPRLYRLLDGRWQFIRERGLEMEPGLPVASEQAVDAGQFEPDAGQIGADREDGFETPGGLRQVSRFPRRYSTASRWRPTASMCRRSISEKRSRIRPSLRSIFFPVPPTASMSSFRSFRPGISRWYPRGFAVAPARTRKAATLASSGSIPASSSALVMPSRSGGDFATGGACPFSACRTSCYAAPIGGSVPRSINLAQTAKESRSADWSQHSALDHECASGQAEEDGAVRPCPSVGP